MPFHINLFKPSLTSLLLPWFHFEFVFRTFPSFFPSLDLTLGPLGGGTLTPLTPLTPIPVSEINKSMLSASPTISVLGEHNAQFQTGKPAFLLSLVPIFLLLTLVLTYSDISVLSIP